MSSWIRLYINTKNTELKDSIALIEELSGLKKSNNTTSAIDFFSVPIKEGNPNYFAIGQANSNWLAVFFNSSYKMQEFCEEYSKRFGFRMILTFAQSVSDYYYLAVYEKGLKIRELEYCYSDDKATPIDFGDKFEYEFNEDNEWKYEYLFNFKSMIDFCLNNGIEMRSDDSKIDWVILGDNS